MDKQRTDDLRYALYRVIDDLSDHLEENTISVETRFDFWGQPNQDLWDLLDRYRAILLGLEGTDKEEN